MCKLIVLCNFCGPNRDETVAVGAPLYELDTEAEASVATSAATMAPKAAEPPKIAGPAPVATPVKAVPPPAVKKTLSHRAPSIKFLGKAGWSRILSVPKTAAPIVYVIPPNYGRPPFSEEEMEALLMGGANLTPDVKKHSDGAMFG
jgi:pyruvate/2-oxoglutarate dehydrogenase complex dihydrolipoamide acyltransferase (E2) component